MSRRVALVGLLAFVAIVVAQHALEPQLTPNRHTISEYANADAGALMTGAFVAWATSLVATSALAWWVGDRGRRRTAQGLLAALLGVAAAGLLLTAWFPTQTSAGALPPGTRLTNGGRIHNLASGATLLAMLGAVTVSIAAFWGRPRFRWLACAALAISVVASSVLLAIGPPVDGIRQRVLVATACAWQAALIQALTRER